MEDSDTEKYHPNRVIQDFVFLSRKSGCIRCISLQVYNKLKYVADTGKIQIYGFEKKFKCIKFYIEHRQQTNEISSI